ncbi:MAG TPA: type III pantothenate kinase [Tepidisphaeraceae bacterium]|nr:type III pantothenate kinase [Tepidisphaeraceae bacterium]
MDINLLVLNLGNSRLALGAFAAGQLSSVKHVPHAIKNDWAATINDVWKSLEDNEGIGVVGASVNPELEAELERAVQQATGKKIEWIGVGRDIDLPIKVRTEEPGETGVDRVLNIAAAYESMGKACVVVDAGTAITIDVCNDEGEFLGGAIAPGVNVMLQSLHEKTAKLPSVQFRVPSGPFGTTTETAMLQAAYHGIRGLVKELAENYAMELGEWPEIIATGGDAPKLFENWELIHAIAPDLTLYGIALAYANHHIKHRI